eukprot:scaffold1021_cov241-Pinguiococcus_pyrenoidosus.AAC.15
MLGESTSNRDKLSQLSNIQLSKGAAARNSHSNGSAENKQCIKLDFGPAPREIFGPATPGKHRGTSPTTSCSLRNPSQDLNLKALRRPAKGGSPGSLQAANLPAEQAPDDATRPRKGRRRLPLPLQLQGATRQQQGGRGSAGMSRGPASALGFLGGGRNAFRFHPGSLSRLSLGAVAAPKPPAPIPRAYVSGSSGATVRLAALATGSRRRGAAEGRPPRPWTRLARAAPWATRILCRSGRATKASGGGFFGVSCAAAA